MYCKMCVHCRFANRYRHCIIPYVALLSRVYAASTSPLSPRLGATIVTSAQLLQTCVDSSQSHRHPNTYSPTGRSFGMSTSSTITPPVQSPEHAPSTSMLCALPPGCAYHPSSQGHGGKNCLQPLPTGSPFLSSLHPCHPLGWPDDDASKSIQRDWVHRPYAI